MWMFSGTFIVFKLVQFSNMYSPFWLILHSSFMSLSSIWSTVRNSVAQCILQMLEWQCLLRICRYRVKGFCSRFAKISNPLFDPKRYLDIKFTHLMVTLRFCLKKWPLHDQRESCSPTHRSPLWLTHERFMTGCILAPNLCSMTL